MRCWIKQERQDLTYQELHKPKKIDKKEENQRYRENSIFV